MTSLSVLHDSTPTLRQRVTPQEWEVRVKLAAAYRLAAHHQHRYHGFSAQSKARIG